MADYLLIDTLKEACLEYISTQALEPDQVFKVFSHLESFGNRFDVSNTFHSILSRLTNKKYDEVLLKLDATNCSLEILRVITAYISDSPNPNHERSLDLAFRWIDSHDEPPAAVIISQALSFTHLASFSTMAIAGRCALSKYVTPASFISAIDSHTAKVEISLSKLKETAQSCVASETFDDIDPNLFVVSKVIVSNSHFDAEPCVRLRASKKKQILDWTDLILNFGSLITQKAEIPAGTEWMRFYCHRSGFVSSQLQEKMTDGDYEYYNKNVGKPKYPFKVALRDLVPEKLDETNNRVVFTQYVSQGSLLRTLSEVEESGEEENGDSEPE